MLPTSERLLTKLRKAPLVNFSEIADKIVSLNAHEISRAADQDAERLVLIGAYLSARANGRDHAGARKQANSQLVRVRRAMGYTYPKSGVANASW